MAEITIPELRGLLAKAGLSDERLAELAAASDARTGNEHFAASRYNIPDEAREIHRTLSADHYATAVALRALPPLLARVEAAEAENGRLRAILADLVEIDRRDNLTDPAQAAADWFREKTWKAARAALAPSPGRHVSEAQRAEAFDRAKAAYAEFVEDVDDYQPWTGNTHEEALKRALSAALACLLEPTT